MAGAQEVIDSLERVLRLVLPRFADACLVDVFGPDGELTCLAAAHSQSEKNSIVHAEVGLPPRAGAPRDQVARSGNPVLVARMDDRVLDAIARSDEHRASLGRLPLRSLLAVPLRLGGRTLGVLTCGITESERRFDESDVAWSESFARHVSALLGDAEQRTLREHAERAADRMTRLQAITSALSRAPDRRDVAAVILRHGSEALGAQAGLLVQLDGSSLVVVQSFNVPSQTEGKTLPLDRPLPLSEAVRSGVPVIISSAAEVRERFPLFERVATLHAGGLAAVPLIVDGRTLGGFQLCFAEGCHPRDLDSGFLMTIAELAAQALERARALDDARTAEARFRSLADVVHQHVFIEGPGGTFEYLNQRARKYYGLSDEEAATIDVKGLRVRGVHPDDLPPALVASEAARKTRSVIYACVRLRRADGVYRRFVIRSIPIDDTGTRWLGTSTDVEDVIRTEAALAENEASLRYLVDSSILGIVHFDGPGNITAINATASNTLGYTAEDVANLHFSAFIPPEGAEQSVIDAERLRRDGFVMPYEMECVRKDGTHVPALVGAVMSPSGERGVGFIIDLTERKRIEREHRALIEVEQGFRERLLAIVGHDLRNPLAAIDTWTRILERSTTLGERDRTAVDRINRSAVRMRRLIEQLVDFTCAREAGGMHIEPREVDLADICHAACDELNVAHFDRIQLFTDGDLVGNWDGDRLAQVVSNLAANALQHGDGGPVTVRATGSSTGVRLAVHNGGKPIPDDALPYLFDPFRRGRATSRASRSENLGLGLYIAHQIVLAHAGTLAVTSTAESGTTFIVILQR
jgi:PAS domain S-box-containing protein